MSEGLTPQETEALLERRRAEELARRLSPLRERLARELAMAALAAVTVPGAPAWCETGNASLLSRPWRRLLCAAAERILVRLEAR